MSAPTESLRRNLIVASAIGARAGAQTALERLRETRRPAKWLVKQLEGILERATVLPPELAQWRDAAPDYPYVTAPRGKEPGK